MPVLSFNYFFYYSKLPKADSSLNSKSLLDTVDRLASFQSPTKSFIDFLRFFLDKFLSFLSSLGVVMRSDLDPVRLETLPVLEKVCVYLKRNYAET